MACPSDESLLRFLYDEALSSERNAIQHHLRKCVECCENIAAFRTIEANLSRVGYDESRRDIGEDRCLGTTTLATYLSGQLTQSEREVVEAHLADCQACVDEIVAVDAQITAPLIQTPARGIEKAVNLDGTKANAEEEVLSNPLQLIRDRSTGPDPESRSLCYGASATLMTGFILPFALAAATEENFEFAHVQMFHSNDQRAQATVRRIEPEIMAVAIETRDGQLGMTRWGFRFSHQDGSEILTAEMALQPIPEESGLWEGRLEIPLTLTEPWYFEFYTLANERGDLA
jgi:anti-sigma factor RsiW